MAERDSRVLAEIEGKAVHTTFQGVIEAFWGTTRLELEPLRIVEKTRFLIHEREAQILLSKIDGVHFAPRGNPALLILGLATMVLFGLGLVFLLLYAIFQKRFLIIAAPGMTLALRAKGDPEKCLDFMDRVMAQMEKLAKPPAPLEPRATLPPSSPPLTLPAPAASQRSSAISDNVTVHCKSCDTEMSVPPGPPGRRFRCPRCKEIVHSA